MTFYPGDAVIVSVEGKLVPATLVARLAIGVIPTDAQWDSARRNAEHYQHTPPWPTADQLYNAIVDEEDQTIGGVAFSDVKRALDKLLRAATVAK